MSRPGPGSFAVALSCAAAALALTAAPRAARAQHEHHGGASCDEGAAGARCAPRSSFGAAVGVVAADYDSMLFTGDYQGLAVTARWWRGRYAAAVGLAGYRIDKNGKAVTGLGDAMLHAHATLAAWPTRAGAVAAGAMAMVMLPTGDHDAGLGMGHVMLMPSAWLAWSPGRLALGATAGYARGLGDSNIHAQHGGGSWPLVDPMTPSEVTFGGSAMARVAGGARAGLRVDGAVPLDTGDTRVAGGVRASWTRGRVETTAELAAGLAGKPFGVRGLVEAGVRF